MSPGIFLIFFFFFLGEGEISWDVFKDVSKSSIFRVNPSVERLVLFHFSGLISFIRLFLDLFLEFCFHANYDCIKI